MKYALHINKERDIYTIPEDVTIIDGYAFYGQQTLRYIEMNEKVKIIKEYAFHGMTQLRTITLPSTIQQIEGNAFSECTSMKMIIIQANSNDITNCESTAFSHGQMYVKEGNENSGICGKQTLYGYKTKGKAGTNIHWMTIESGSKMIIYGINYFIFKVITICYIKFKCINIIF